MEWDNIAFDVSSQEFLNVIKYIIPKKPVQKKKYLIEYPKRLSIVSNQLPKTKPLRSKKISIGIEKQHAKVQLPMLTHKTNTSNQKIRESQSLKINKGSKILTNCKLQPMQVKEDRMSVQVIKVEEKEEIQELSTEKKVEYNIEKMNIGVKRRRKTKDSQPKESLQSLLARTKIDDDVIIKRNNNFQIRGKEPQTVRISSLQHNISQPQPQPQPQQSNPQNKMPSHKKINPEKPSRSLNCQKQSSPPKLKQHPSIPSILQMVKQEEQKRRKRREQAEAEAAKKEKKQKAEEEEEEKKKKKEEEEGQGNKNIDIDQPVKKHQVIPEQIQEQYNSNVCGNMSKLENSSIQEYIQEENYV